MLRSTALGLNRGLNHDRGGKKAWANAFQRNLAMRSVPNPRGLCSGQPPVSHIEAHLDGGERTDPLTGEPLESGGLLVPNRALQQTIAEWWSTSVDRERSGASLFARRST